MINHELETGVTESARRINDQELREFGDNAPFVCLFSGGKDSGLAISIAQDFARPMALIYYIRLQEVDLERCQIRIQQGKGGKERMVPFPHAFRELLGLHIQQMQQKQAGYLFESVRKHKYSDRGVSRMLERYATAAGIIRSLSPHKWRHFLFTWLKAQGIDDALIQPYSGHESRQSFEIYSRLSLGEAQPVYEQAMERFPIP